MRARIEVTKQHKGTTQRGRRVEKFGIMDRYCQSTGLSRSTAKRYLSSETLGEKNVLRIDRRKSRPSKTSPAAKEKLVWWRRVMLTPCGKV